MADEQQQACDCPVCKLRELILDVMEAYGAEERAKTGDRVDPTIAVRALAQVAGGFVSRATNAESRSELVFEFMTTFGGWSGARVEVSDTPPDGVEHPETKH
jgi:hypothetical protein